MMAENQCPDACDSIVELYAAREMTREQAILQLVRLGLDHDEARDFLQSAIA